MKTSSEAILNPTILEDALNNVLTRHNPNVVEMLTHILDSENA